MVRSGGGGFTFVISSTSQLMTNEPTSSSCQKGREKLLSRIYIHITCVMRDYGVDLS